MYKISLCQLKGNKENSTAKELSELQIYFAKNYTMKHYDVIILTRHQFFSSFSTTGTKLFLIVYFSKDR